jgi:type IV secretion system protein VirD4
MNQSRSPGPSDALLLGVIGLVLSLGALVWLWGGIAGELFGRGWPPGTSAGAVLGVFTRLPTDLAHPAAAWPARARAELPGAAGCYAALALLVGLVAAAALLASRAGLPGLAHGPEAGARWASRGELGVLRGRQRDRGRLVLGRHGRRTLYAEQRHALVAFGPPQSGKSAGLAIPALLEWDGPAVASSIKTDLLAATIARRRQLGTAFVFDPFELAGTESHTWSPLGAARSWDGALEVAWRLAAAGELDQKGVEGGDFWAIAAEQRLAPLLYAAAGTGAGIDRVVRWAYGQGLRELDAALAELTGTAEDEQSLAGAHAAYDAVRAFETQADRTRSSIEATAQGLLRAYRFNRVARSARSCEITADRILDEAATLYLIGDAKASKLLRPLFLALVSEVVDRAYERANLAGGRLELPLLLCLDEAGNVAPLPNLAEIASTAPSHNIQLISIFHDLAQARSRYAKQAETVVNAHRARMLLPGVADLETLRYFSGLVGEEEASEQTRTTGVGGTSRSTGAHRRRPRIAAEALRQLPDGHALLLYGRLAPVRLRLRMWFSDRRLRTLAAADNHEDRERR